MSFNWKCFLLNACIYLRFLCAERFRENTAYSMLKLLIFSTKSIMWLLEHQFSSVLSKIMVEVNWWWSFLTFSHRVQDISIYMAQPVDLINSSDKCYMIIASNNLALISLNQFVVWFHRGWIDISMHVQRDPTVCPSFMSWSLALSKGISSDAGLVV